MSFLSDQSMTKKSAVETFEIYLKSENYSIFHPVYEKIKQPRDLQSTWVPSFLPLIPNWRLREKYNECGVYRLCRSTDWNGQHGKWFQGIGTGSLAWHSTFSVGLILILKMRFQFHGESWSFNLNELTQCDYFKGIYLWLYFEWFF